MIFSSEEMRKSENSAALEEIIEFQIQIFIEAIKNVQENETHNVPFTTLNEWRSKFS